MQKPAERKAPPRYQEVADELMADIGDGRFQVGDMLPTELILCERFQVSRFTVREALRRLEEMGLVTRRQGSGTVVRAAEAQGAYVQALHSIAELLQYPPETEMHVVDTEMFEADRKSARFLHCKPGETRCKIRGVRRVAASGQPICWTEVNVIPEYAGVVEQIGKKTLPVYGLVEKEYGVNIRNVSVELYASGVPADLARHLDVEPGTPALYTVRRYTDVEDRVFEVSVSVHPENRFTYRINLRRDWGSAD